MNKDLVTLGVDLGGTKVKTAIVDSQGRILYSHRIPTRAERDPDQIVLDIVACINECQKNAKRKADGLGVGIAGQVSKSGMVHFAPNLRWWNYPLKDRLKENLDMPVYILNDVRAATWGEWCFGAGVGADDVVVLFIGTGIGGGIISDGKMLSGCSNAAGEIGHTTIFFEGRQCHCRNRGCLEAYVGGWAIAERAQEQVRNNPTAGERLIKLAGSIYKISAATVSQAFQEKDWLATLIVKETGEYLSAGLVSIVNSFNPCLLVLGGGIIEGLPNLISMAEKSIKERALEIAIRKLKFKKSALGENAGIIGSATLVQNLL